MKPLKFKNFNLIKKFLEGSSLLSLEKVLRILLGLTVHSWVVRSLGSEKVGYISYVSGVVLIFQAFSVFGLDEIASKKFVQMKGHVQTFQDISAIRFRFAFFSYLLLALFSLLTHFDDSTTMLMCFVFGLSLFPKSFITLENYSMSQGHYNALFWSRISAAILVNLGKILAVLLNVNLITFMVIYLFEELVQRFINYQFVKRHVQLEKVRWLAPMKKDLLLQALPMLLYSLSVIIDQKIIIILLQYYNKMSDLGVFSVSFGLYEYTSMFPLILSSVLFPSVVRAHGKNEALYTKRRQYLSDLMVVMGIVVALGFYFLGDLVISTLFGDAYSEGKIYLKMLGFLCPILFFNMARLRWFVIEGLMHEWMILSFTCLVVNILLQIYVLPQYGVKGGIIAVYLSIFIGNALCSLIFHSIRTSAGVFLKSMFFWLRIKSLYNDLKKEI